MGGFRIVISVSRSVHAIALLVGGESPFRSGWAAFICRRMGGSFHQPYKEAPVRSALRRACLEKLHRPVQLAHFRFPCREVMREKAHRIRFFPPAEKGSPVPEENFYAHSGDRHAGSAGSSLLLSNQAAE